VIAAHTLSFQGNVFQPTANRPHTLGRAKSVPGPLASTTLCLLCSIIFAFCGLVFVQGPS